jgi:hypothetical protein
MSIVQAERTTAAAAGKSAPAETMTTPGIQGMPTAANSSAAAGSSATALTKATQRKQEHYGKQYARDAGNGRDVSSVAS